MTDRFESLEHGEVISVQHETQVLSGHRTFRVGELSTAIKEHLEKAIENWTEENNAWFSSQGIDCEALRFGSNGWQKGRIRLSLEFCPDLPNPADRSTANSIPTTAPTAQIGQAIGPPPTTPSPVPATSGSHEIGAGSVVNTTAIDPTPDAAPTATILVAEHLATPTHHPASQHDNHTAEILAAALPVAGIAAVGGATVAAIAAPELQAVSNLAPHADTTLELESHPSDPSAPNSGGFDEIAFDFDLANSDRGIRIPNGMMELDLADIGLDFSEHESLDFEDNGIFHPTTEFINLQDIDRPENSGMLIDEVWNEMNQGNWPGIN
jgi:KGK domain